MTTLLQYTGSKWKDIDLKGDPGKPGKDADESKIIKETKEISQKAIKDHETSFDHSKIHDPQMLGSIRLDESTKAHNRFLKYDETNNRFIFSRVPSQGIQDRIGGGSTSKLNVRSESSNYTANAGDNVILVDASSSAVTITLPPASSSNGANITVKKTDSSNNEVTIDGNGSETIDGSTTIDLLLQYDSATISSDSSNWFIL